MDSLIQDKILSVLEDEDFYKENSEIGDPEEIINIICAKVPEASPAEVDKVLTQISTVAMEKGDELTAENLESVSGGVVGVTTAMAVAIIRAAYTTGKAVGYLIWNWKNRKCKPSK